MPVLGFASDLHLPGEHFYELVLLVERASPDALVLAGDIVDRPEPRGFQRLARLLDRAGISRAAAVLGNHEHYLTRSMIRRGQTSLDAARRSTVMLEEIGVPVLDSRERPLMLAGAWVAGSVGWYDYSYAPPWATRDMIEACNPHGATLQDLEACVLRREHWRCPEWWRNDCLLTRIPRGHEWYARLNADRVSKQLQQAGRPRIVVYHHVPRKELLPRCDCPRDLDNAYAGSPILDRPPRVHGAALVVYGHIHDRTPNRITTIEGITYANAYPLHSRQKGVITVETRTLQLAIV